MAGTRTPNPGTHGLSRRGSPGGAIKAFAAPLICCGVIAAVVLSGCGSSSKHSATTPAGPLARLSPAATRQLEAADATITGLAGSANERKLRALVGEYKAAPSLTRGGILRQIAKLAPLDVNRVPFPDPVSLNEARLHERLSASSSGASSGGSTAPHAVNEVLASIRGAGFQTLVGPATGATGRLTGPLSVAQYLNGEIKDINEAGLTTEATRLLNAEEALPPAPPATRAAYSQQLEGIVATANAAATAAVAALRSEHSSPLYGNRVSSAAMKLELTPPATFASFGAALALRPVLKDLAVNLNVLLVGGHHVAELDEQLRTLGKTVATAVAGLTGPGSGCGACPTPEGPR